MAAATSMRTAPARVKCATASSKSSSVPGCPVRQVIATPTRHPSMPAAARTAVPVVAARTSRRAATSATERAIGPGLSWLALIGTTPTVGTVPTVGLMPTTPLSDAGQVIEPSVSVPIAKGESPAARAAPDPDDEPPALRSNAHGLAQSPPTADQPLVERDDRRLAHSERLVVPSTSAPACRRRATSSASARGGRP